MSVSELPLPVLSREQVELNNCLQGYQLRYIFEGEHSFICEGVTLAQHLPDKSLSIELVDDSQEEGELWRFFLDEDAANAWLACWLGSASISDLPLNLVAAACELWLDQMATMQPALKALKVKGVTLVDGTIASVHEQQVVRANLTLSAQPGQSAQSAKPANCFDVYCMTSTRALITFLERHGQQKMAAQPLYLAMSYLVGHTSIEMDEFRQLESGDVLLFSQSTHVGERACGVKVQGQLCWLAHIEEQRIILIKRWNTSMTEDLNDEMNEDKELGELPDDEHEGEYKYEHKDEQDVPSLDALPMQIQFELPGDTMAVSDIQSLSEGHVFKLVENADSQVAIIVNGKPYGRGQLVNVEGRLGVQIVKWGSNGY